MNRLPLILLLLGSFIFTPGFVCATRVERVEGEVEALRIQFEEIQQRINDDQAQVTEMLLRADNQVAELEELQHRLEKNVQTSSLDLQLELDGQKEEVAALRGTVLTTSNDLRKLQQDVKAVVSSLGSSGGSTFQLPSGADALFTFSDQAYNNAAWGKAAVGFTEFASRHGSDTRVAEALYKLAQSQFQTGDFDSAGKSARMVVENYRDSTYVNDSIFVWGQAAEGAGDTALACAAYDQLKNTKSHKEKVRKARKKLKC